MYMVGIRDTDVFQNTSGYGMFTGGLGLHGGVQNIGGTVIPMSSGNTQKQIQLMHDFGAKALACTPSMLCIWQKLSAIRVFLLTNSNFG